MRTVLTRVWLSLMASASLFTLVAEQGRSAAAVCVPTGGIAGAVTKASMQIATQVALVPPADGCADGYFGMTAHASGGGQLLLGSCIGAVFALMLAAWVAPVVAGVSRRVGAWVAHFFAATGGRWPTRIALSAGIVIGRVTTVMGRSVGVAAGRGPPLRLA